MIDYCVAGERKMAPVDRPPEGSESSGSANKTTDESVGKTKPLQPASEADASPDEKVVDAVESPRRQSVPDKSSGRASVTDATSIVDKLNDKDELSEWAYRVECQLFIMYALRSKKTSETQ